MNAIVSKLASLGFTKSSLIGEKNGIATLRIRTLQGWTYERFAAPEDVDAWSLKHEPEED